MNFRTAVNHRAHIMFGEQAAPSLPANLSARPRDKFISFPDLFLECKFSNFIQPHIGLTYSGSDRERFWKYVTDFSNQYKFSVSRGGGGPGYSGGSVWDISPYAAAKLLFGLRKDIRNVRFRMAELPEQWRNLTFRIEKD